MKEIRKPLRVTYDVEADAAYIYLSDEIGMGGVADSVPLDPAANRGMINLDFDAEGRLVGIEVLAASKRMPLGLLKDMDDG